MSTDNMTREEKAIYNAYRAALRSMVGGYAPQRRQRARALTAERCKVRYAEVKRVIALAKAED